MRTQLETDAQDIAQAKKYRDAYCMAMINGTDDICTLIEQKYDLYGYPPEIVSFGLNAAAEGKDIMQEISRKYE